MSKKTEAENARALALSAGIDLRLILNDARDELDRFEKYVDSWDDAVRTTEDPLEFTEQFVVERAMTLVDELVHMPTGGTQHMHVRTARTRLLQLVAAGTPR